MSDLGHTSLSDRHFSASSSNLVNYMAKNAKVIDLFCGAGGLSLGAHFAGFKTAVAVDIDANLTSSYGENFPGAKLLSKDLSQLSGRSLLEEAGFKAKEISGIIGGPPCQGFSLMGRRDMADPRNAMIGHFFRLVHEIKPSFFVMENVPGILLGDAKTALEDLIDGLKGYDILGPIHVNASDFGAATNRERVIVIGLRGGRITQMELDKQKTTKSFVRNAIADLPEPKAEGWGHYRRIEVSSYASRARKIRAGLGAALFIQATRDGLVSGIQPTLHTDKVQRRFSLVLPGTNDTVSRCPRLSWNAVAPTLRAGTGPDHGSYQSIRPIHPERDRVITVREAARLQGFPDWFKFHDTKWHSFRMIGNSVSPFMSEALLKAIAHHV
jgi:DNA (cytosine-5)-methyltransferase 1